MKKTYVITTAQRGGLPHRNLLKGFETIADKYDAQITVLPTNGRHPSSTKADQDEVLHKIFAQYVNVDGDHKLNSNIDIRFFPVKAQQMDPTTSWDRFVGYDTSAIMPSPKQRLRVVPTSNQEMPRVLMSTGAITKPNYKMNSWGQKAYLDHILGGILLEVVDDKYFHFRQLRASKNGVFYDLGLKYDGDKKPIPVRPVRVYGDIHHHQLNEEAWESTQNFDDKVNPKMGFYHDLFDGYSINHHDTNSIITRTQKYGLSLEEELYNVGCFLQANHERRPDMQHIIVRSNHDMVIDRYLQEGRFVNDPQNIDIALKLFQALRAGKNPLEEGIRLTHGRVNKTKFLKLEDDYKVFGNQVGVHGHLGIKGGRGSLRTFEKCYAKGARAHGHGMEILRYVCNVGVMGNLDQGYNKGGADDWSHTNASFYPNGHFQLETHINGKWRG